MDIRHTASLIFLIVAGIYLVLFLIGIIWYIHPFKAMTWFYHDIMGWHKPDDSVGFDGASFTSRCRFCGKEILQDSQGNWFEA